MTHRSDADDEQGAIPAIYLEGPPRRRCCRSGWLRPSALAQGDGELIVGISSDINTLDPQMSPIDVFRHTIRSTVFEALVFINPDTLKADPHARGKLGDLARWPDRNLQAEVRASPGTTVRPSRQPTSSIRFKRVQDKEVGSPFAPQLVAVSNVEAVDDLTVKLTLANPVPGILANLAVIQIVKESNVAAINTAPIGTGPFKFASWAPGDHIRVERFAEHRNAPQVGAIEWRIVPDSQARLAGMQDGTLQMVALVEGKDVVQAQAAGIEVIQTKPYILYENFNINTRRAPFDDKRVRQAFAHAFDRESYAKTVWFGFARPTINPVPQEMATYLAGIGQHVSVRPGQVSGVARGGRLHQGKPAKDGDLDYPGLRLAEVDGADPPGQPQPPRTPGDGAGT